ncbi:MAG: flavodoxin family protein [Candidatus Bathyarchaeota archaeon]|nr:flavodoxin family protein [Candidatus Bathyarchaeota archaeon]MDH5779983.1 flavodoxin family protein [Candidatus Bathyarchaeota archaeon]
MKLLLVTYYTETGHTKRMAEEIGEGAERLGVEAEAKRIEECGLNDLVEADGIVIGSPTYFSNVSWRVKKLIDESIALYRKRRQLTDKVGGCFTSSGTRRDGKDCIRMLELAFGLHHKMKMIPGIIRASGDREEEVSKMCQQYGMKVARQILS